MSAKELKLEQRSPTPGCSLQLGRGLFETRLRRQGVNTCASVLARSSPHMSSCFLPSHAKVPLRPSCARSHTKLRLCKQRPLGLMHEAPFVWATGVCTRRSHKWSCACLCMSACHSQGTIPSLPSRWAAKPERLGAAKLEYDFRLFSKQISNLCVS